MTNPISLFVGCYTSDDRPTSIHVFDATEPENLIARCASSEVENASFLAVHPTRRVLYAVNEHAERDGTVSALALDPDHGALVVLGTTASEGRAPCYVSVALDGTHLLVANYVSGTVASIALGPDGGLGSTRSIVQHEGSGPHWRQDGPHAHCVVLSATGRSVYAADLGADRVLRSVVRGGGTLHPASELDMPAGSGPRHIALHPTMDVVFVVGELDSTLACVTVDPATEDLFRAQSISTLPEAFEGESIAADVHVHPNGRFVYVSNRGHDSIATFAVDAESRQVRLLGHVASGGTTPRGFAIHPSGRSLVVANQDSDVIVPFAIDIETGMPSRSGEGVEVSRPVCLRFAERSGESSAASTSE